VELIHNVERLTQELDALLRENKRLRARADQLERWVAKRLAE
jgi:hypothetical protein